MSDQLMKAFSQRYTTLHAGAFAKGECGILVPGESHAGKSTTSAFFALSGFRFYTDDVAVFDDDLRLQPYPKAVMLRNGGWYRLLELFPNAEDRLIWGNDACQAWYVDGYGTDVDQPPEARPHVRLIVIPTRDPGAPIVTPLTRSEAIPVLVNQCFGMAADPAGSVESIVRLVSGADCYRVNMLDPIEAVDAVGKLAQALS